MPMPNLIVKYTVQKIYIDGANPSFIKSLKMQWGERSDYENVPKEQKQFMKVEPVNFNQGQRNIGTLQAVIGERIYCNQSCF
jgi:hypothetical protein